MTPFAFLRPETVRNLLIILIGGGYLGYHLFRWWQRRRQARAINQELEEEFGGGVESRTQPEARKPESAATPAVREMPPPSEVSAVRVTHARPDDESASVSGVADTAGNADHRLPEAASGEELYARARAMRHQPIPDFSHDSEYLVLLGQSATSGYAPALSKLGEYAMRRGAWVEAYYWMRKSQRSGMHGLNPALRTIRSWWAKDGFPRQSQNVNPLFNREAGSIGLAWLQIDSGQEAAAARAFLKSHYPDLL